MAGTPNDVLKTMKDQGIEVVDVRFCDLPGLMQHFSVPAHELSEDVFEGPRSLVFPEAENRLHFQKGLLAVLMGGM